MCTISTSQNAAKATTMQLKQSGQTSNCNNKYSDQFESDYKFLLGRASKRPVSIAKPLAFNLHILDPNSGVSSEIAKAIC